MGIFEVFLTTFFIVFIGELGDKTQIAAGTGSLAHKREKWVIFFSSSLALVCVAGVTTFAAKLIPQEWIGNIITMGGVLLILYGFLLIRAITNQCEIEGEQEQKSSKHLFAFQFFVVLMAELGDKTQIATLAIAVENQDMAMMVFLGSATALITVTGLTVWGVSLLPCSWVKRIQILGALLLIMYGLYMVL